MYQAYILVLNASNLSGRPPWHYSKDAQLPGQRLRRLGTAQVLQLEKLLMGTSTEIQCL